MPENVLKFCNLKTDFYVPDGMEDSEALRRITHLGVGAHQDDLEIMAYDGIIKCFHSSTAWFGGVICTSGSGSARDGEYANYSDEEMAKIRSKEQKIAADIGKYGALIQLGYESAEIRGLRQKELEDDLFGILESCSPEVVYTHDPADRHLTHLVVFWSTLRAIRKLPKEQRPRKLYGCEGWRDLDWVPNNSKVIFDVSENMNLARDLIDVYDSQIAGGKNYSDAIIGRRAANATFNDPYSVDFSSQLSKAIDLTPLIEDDSIDVISYMTMIVDEFKNEVDWESISKYQKLSENFIIEFQNKVDWYKISKNQTLSEDFKKRI